MVVIFQALSWIEALYDSSTGKKVKNTEKEVKILYKEINVREIRNIKINEATFIDQVEILGEENTFQDRIVKKEIFHKKKDLTTTFTVSNLTIYLNV